MRPDRSKREEKLCSRCGERPALFYVKGKMKRKCKSRVRYDPNHDLCQRCFCSERDRRRAEEEKEKESHGLLQKETETET